jgi:pimeloyl-ACP methyl ester carboxylesterase
LRDWRRDQLAAVSPAFESVTIIAYPTDQALGYAALERLVRATLPPTRPFVLLGESFSGPIALAIAARPPANLIALILSTSFARYPARLVSPLAPFVRFGPVQSIPFAWLSWYLLGRWATPQIESLLKGALTTVAPTVLRSRVATALRVDVSSSLRAVSVPILYLRATHDRLLSPSAGKYILSVAPHCTIADVVGPHLLLQAAPRACAQVVGDFAARLG